MLLAAATDTRAAVLAPPAESDLEHCPQRRESSAVLTANSPNLDCLRAIAVLLVLFDHLGLALGFKHGLSALGMCGVLFFFVHTTLVLMLSMDRLKLTGGPLLLSFYTRRAFRIYPLSIATVILASAVASPRAPIGAVLSNVTLAMNLTGTEPILGQLWSLPYEVQMYLFLPALFLFRDRLRRPVAWLVLYATAACVALVQPRILAAADLAQYSGCFLPGLLAYQLRPRYRWSWWIWPLGLGTLAIAWAAFSALHPIPTFPGRWVLCILIGLAIPQFAPIGSPAVKWLASRIAKYSYGIYLSHTAALWAGFVWLAAAGAAVRWAVFLALLVMLPVVGYHLIEAPFVKLGKGAAESLRAGTGRVRGAAAA